MFFLPNRIRFRTYQAGLMQAKAYRALTNYMTISLAPHDLSLPEWALLGLLRDHGKMRPSDLSDHLGVKRPVVTASLKRLESLDMVERHPDKDDSRVVDIALSQHGQVQVDSIEKILRVEMRAYLKDIKFTDLLIYISVLNKLADKQQ
jgi:DNA-binding MarR family transcriptional regulator